MLCVTAVVELKLVQCFSMSTWTKINCNNQNCMDPGENIFVFVPSACKWMLVTEWKRVWWLAALWGNWAWSRAAVLWSQNPLWLSAVCNPHSPPLLTSSIRIYLHKKDGIPHAHCFFAHSIFALFLRILQTLQWNVFRGVFIFSPSQPPRMPLSTKSKCLSSLPNKRLYVGIASNASSIWLVLPTLPPTRHHLHLAGMMGPWHYFKGVHDVTGLFIELSTRVQCDASAHSPQFLFFSPPMMKSDLKCDQTYRLFLCNFSFTQAHLDQLQCCILIWSLCMQCPTT